MHKHARLEGASSPRKFWKIRYSEIASEAILGQKQGCSSYMVHRALHTVFVCPYVWTFAKPGDIEFPWEKVVRRTTGKVTDGEGKAASLYDMQQDVFRLTYNVPYIFMHFHKDGTVTPACLVATSLLAVTTVLLNSRASEMANYLCMHLHMSPFITVMQHFCMRSVFICQF